MAPREPADHTGSEYIAEEFLTGFQGASPEAENAAFEGLTSEMREQTGGAVSAVADGPDVPENAPKLYSFSEAREFLNRYGIDLDAHNEEEVKSAIRWGLVEKNEGDHYGAEIESKFEVSVDDLKAVADQLEANPSLKQRIVLAVDNMTYAQALTKLIDNLGTQRVYVRNRSLRYLRVDPSTKMVLQDQRPSGKAGILFTPDQMNLPGHLRRISADDQLLKMVQGQKYMGPVGWMKLFRQGVDRGAFSVLYPDRDLDNLHPDAYKVLRNRALLDRRIDPYLLDTVTGTQFPDYHRFDGDKNGDVPCLSSHPYPSHRRVHLFDYFPDEPHVLLGGRPVLGSFLS